MFFTLRVFSVTGNHTGPVRIFPTVEFIFKLQFARFFFIFTVNSTTRVEVSTKFTVYSLPEKVTQMK